MSKSKMEKLKKKIREDEDFNDEMALEDKKEQKVADLLDEVTTKPKKRGRPKKKGTDSTVSSPVKGEKSTTSEEKPKKRAKKN